MTVKPEQKLKSVAFALAIGGGCLALLALGYIFLTPKFYQARARIKVVDWVHSKDLDNPSDLSVIAAECEMLRSNALIDGVISNLGLAEAWGKRYKQGVTLAADEARDRFNTKTTIEPVEDSTLIDIRVKSEDRVETAKIANELARIYLGLRNSQRQELIREKLGALKQTWGEQNQKLTNAQAQVDRLYIVNLKTRVTNQIRVYDPDAYSSNHVEMEAAYVAQKNELDGFKRMDAETLKQVLSSMDTNSALVPLVAKMNKARSDLLKAKLEQGPDARETKDAELAVTQLDKAISQQVAGIILVKENKVATLKTMLDRMDARIKTTPLDLNRETSEYAEYTNALETMRQLKAERDELETKLREAESKEAIVPTGVTVDLIDSAETPLRPYIPDGTLGLEVMGGAGLIALAGLVVALIARRKEAL